MSKPLFSISTPDPEFRPDEPLRVNGYLYYPAARDIELTWPEIAQVEPEPEPASDDDFIAAIVLVAIALVILGLAVVAIAPGGFWGWIGGFRG